MFKYFAIYCLTVSIAYVVEFLNQSKDALETLNQRLEAIDTLKKSASLKNLSKRSFAERVRQLFCFAEGNLIPELDQGYKAKLRRGTLHLFV